MHYVAKVIREKYPETLNFVHELNYLKKAAAGTVLCFHVYSFAFAVLCVQNLQCLLWHGIVFIQYVVSC